MLRELVRRTLGLVAVTLAIGSGNLMAQTFDITESGDFGNSHRNYPSSNAVDGNTSFASRWAATFEGGSANLFVDLGTVLKVDNIGVAWGRGNQRSYDFEVRARSGTSGSWTRIFRGESSGNTTGIENYNVNDFSARQVRVKVFSNTAGTNWADITEFEVYGTGGRSGGNNDDVNDDNDDISVVNIPGKFEAEDFTDYKDNDSSNRGGQDRNTGVDIERCSDSGCGFNIGWMATGEWLEYEINVAKSGNHEAQVRVAATRSRGKISFEVDGKKVSNDLSIDSTGGWQNWRTQTVSLGNLSAGKQTLRLNVVSAGLNLNWINIVADGDSNNPPDNEEIDFGLSGDDEPWENFDLSRWALDSPAPRDDDRCKAERTWDYQWDDNNPLDSSSAPFFFTHTDGGMRFATRIDGQTTNSSCDSGYVRSELREMLRRGDRDIDDTGVTKNNWKLGYQPGSRSNWGGENGRMDATLRVNQVTTSGDSGQVGRVIIGQIHADNDEPLRLYYRKRSGQSKGCIYVGHEIRDSDDVWFDMIGDRDCTSGPSDGIELDEMFSYSIINDGDELTVVIRRGAQDGKVLDDLTINMNELNSGYDRSDEWMYFKAGAYTQNDSGRDSDGDIVTFYQLNVSH